MKKLILLNLLFVSAFLTAQESLPHDSISNKVIFSWLESVDSTSKEELYSRALLSFSKAFNGKKASIEVDDKASGLLIIRSEFTIYSQGLFGEKIYPGNIVTFKTIVRVKSNKFKIEVTDFIVDFGIKKEDLPYIGKPNEYTMTMAYWDRARVSAQTTSQEIINEYRRVMSNQTNKDDW